MKPRSSFPARCGAFAFLLGASVAAAAACSSSHASTADASTDGRIKDATHAQDVIDASCTVDAGPLVDAQIQLGLQLVTARKCESCHGQTLSGNGDGVPSTVETAAVPDVPKWT